MKLSMFCICGSSIYLSGTNFDAVYKATEVWRNFHTGEGHRTCDRKTCLAARRKSERLALLPPVDNELIETGREEWKN